MKQLFPCPCCGHRTLTSESPGSYGLCPVCYWEDDGVQFRDPNYRGGANLESLIEARDNFQRFGASSRGDRPFVRKPLPDEVP
jgi:hypothetical protein